jgi:N-acyl homoserine lactone hydrolase
VPSELPAIHRLLLAEMNLRFRSVERCVLYGFLIEHPDGAILVDTGLGSGNDFIEEMYAPRRHSLPAAIRARGIGPDEVVAIVNTHMHFDHCGGNSQLPDREIYVQRNELEAARRPHYSVPEWVDFEGARLCPVDGDTELASGVHLIPTPGHTAGHQSVLVEGDGARALICGQAAYTVAEFSGEPDLEGATEGDVDRYRASFARMHALAADEVYFSHDAQSWKAPSVRG